MFKFVLVDDDKLALELMTDIMDWKELDFELVETFTDCRTLLDYMKSNQIDLIITDIKIPDISGVDLAEICYKEYPNVKLILISAYRDFEYARCATKFNVCNYIVKPINYQELENSMKEIKTRLESERKKGLFDKDSKQKTIVMRDYLCGVLDSPIIDCLNELGIYVNTEDHPCMYASIKLDNYNQVLKERWKYGEDKFKNAIEMLVPFYDDSAYYFTLKNKEGEVGIFAISTVKPRDMDLWLYSFREKLERNFDTILQLSISMNEITGYENLVAARENIPESFLTEQYIKIVLSAVLEKNTKAIKRLIEDFFNTHKNDTDCVRAVMDNLLVQINIIVYNDEKKEINTAHMSLYELEEYMLDELLSAISENTIVENDIIDVCVKYINEHYNEEISLDVVASIAGFHKTYFSHYFKQKMNESYMSYLTRLRLDKAKQIIEQNPNILMQDVCYQVGYKSVSHFYKIFQQQFGLPPAEYSKRVMNRNK